ncbi:hypothetical protein CMI42_00070 [Candidatus Pacearchaeota archaeon]|nr:hypothetical protein [Candidatus Pacearchaeota archaeon]|tara:strand:+ start:2084 stop:2908 length:825 start_codon:yes stop_codon:yes gene_type:complete
MEPYWELIERIIKESDIVLEILDARLIDLSRNEKVEELVKESGRPLIFVINKSDLISKEFLKSQIQKLEESGEVIYVSAKKAKSMRILFTAIKKIFKKHGKREVIERKIGDPKLKYREAKGEIVVGVLGYPNVGKSSLINALAHKKKVKVSKKAGTTHGIHWVKATDDIKLIDSPGVIPLTKDDETRYGLIGARDSERLKNPEVVAIALIKLFQKNNIKAFEDLYKIETKDKNTEEIIEEIAKKKNYMLKGERFDEHKTCSLIIRDWQHGKLKI